MMIIHFVLRIINKELRKYLYKNPEVESSNESLLLRLALMEKKLEHNFT